MLWLAKRKMIREMEALVAQMEKGKEKEMWMKKLAALKGVEVYDDDSDFETENDFDDSDSDFDYDSESEGEDEIAAAFDENEGEGEEEEEEQRESMASLADLETLQAIYE